MRLFTSLFLAAGLSTAAFADTLIVVTKTDNAVALVDTDTRAVTAHVATGTDPHEAIASPDGRYAYVSDYGQSQGQTISVVDLDTGDVIERWDIGAGTGPHGLAVSADGRLLWVTAERAQAVIEVDTATGVETQRWSTEQRGSHQLVAAPDGARVYVSNIPDNTISIIDRASGEVSRVTTDAGPEGLDISPDGRWLWVGNRSANTITIIDTVSGVVDATIPSGGNVPFRMRFTPDGEEVWVVNAESNEVTVFDAASREIIHRLAFERIPVGIVISPDGETVAVSHTMEDTVSLIDRRTREIEAVVTTGNQPDGMAWAVR